MMANVALVLLTVLLLQLLLAVAWWLGPWVLDLPEQPARLWCASALLGGLAMAMVLGRDWVFTPVSMALSNVVMVCSVLALVRGMRLFLSLKPHHGEALMLLVLSVATGATVSAFNPSWGSSLQAASTSLLLLWPLGHAALEGGQALRREFNARVAVALMMPLALGCLMALLRLVAALAGPARPLQVDTPLHVTVALVLLMAALSVHGSMAAMVVLRLVARLRRLSQHDALTGLLNRAEWTRRLQAQLRWLGRYGDRFSVLMLDIDHFKQINDCYGHAAGDAALVALAQSMVGSARELDEVGRLGGEEFALLLPRVGAEAALQIAERLRLQLQGSTVTWKQQPLRVTVSIGVIEACDADESPAQLMDRVDQALYQAKRGGRNRVVMAPADPAVTDAGPAHTPGRPGAAASLRLSG